ncbi:MAG: signal peptide peptidase SppA [Myxococcota bacterium]
MGRAECVLACVVVALCGAGTASAAPPDPSPRPIVVPWSSTVDLDGAESVLSHAAGLGFIDGVELAAVMTSRLEGRATVAGGGLLLGARLGPLALGLGLGWVGDGPDSDTTTTRIDFGVALRLGASAALGYQFTSLGNDDDVLLDRYATSSLSATFRPWRAFGFGLALDHFNRPTTRVEASEHPLLRLALGLRPADALTFGVEGSRELADDAYWRVTGSARWMVVPGLAVGAYGRFGFAESGPAPATTEVGAMLGLYQGSLGVESGFDLTKVDGAADEARLSVLVRARSEPLPSLVPRSHLVVRLALRGEITERPSTPFLGSPGAGFAHYLMALDMIAADERVDGLVLQIDQAPSWTQSWELREAIARLKAAKKKVVAILTVGDMRAMYLASAADEVHLYAAGALMLFGLSITQSYYLGLMDKLGVKAEFVKFEAYKSAPEAFTRTGPSDPAQEQTRALLDGVDEAWLDAVSVGRRKTIDELKAIRQNGPQTMKDALSLGLVDGLVEADAVGKLVQTVFGAEAHLVDHYEPAVETYQRWGRAPVIAIVPVTGSIVEGGSAGPLPFPIPFLGAETTGDESFVRAVEKAAADPTVAGIIIRVDSGGGSAVGSDRMHRAVVNAAKQKPLIVSFGDIAASGGYYLAAGAPEILASPLTITGSIGIFTGKVDLSGFYALLGITTHTEKTNDRADVLEPYRGFTDPERDRAQTALKAYYDRFVELVSAGRKIPLETAYSVARGRVWLGKAALERHLVDRFGGFHEAMQTIREKAGIAPDAPVMLRYMGGLGPFSSLQRLVGQVFGLDEAPEGSTPSAPPELQALGSMMSALGQGGPLAMLPYTIRISP